jgi:hypothetical protein
MKPIDRKSDTIRFPQHLHFGVLRGIWFMV